MENTMLIQLTNDKAAKLLYELEELHLIKVLKENFNTPKGKLSNKYRGSITKREGEALNAHIENMRSN